MAFTETKLRYPTGSDLFQPHVDIERLARSVIATVPVANRAEADTLRQAVSPSPEKPLIVYRADTDTLERHNGTAWRQIDGPPTQVTLSPGTGWGGSSSWAAKSGEMVTVRAAQIRGSRASEDPWVTLPAGYRPASPLWVPVVTNTFGTALLEVGTNGLCVFHWPTGSTTPTTEFRTLFSFPAGS